MQGIQFCEFLEISTDFKNNEKDCFISSGIVLRSWGGGVCFTFLFVDWMGFSLLPSFAEI